MTRTEPAVDPALWELLLAEEGADDRIVQAIIRLRAPGLEIPGVRIVSRFGRIATCRLPARAVLGVRAHKDVVSLKAARWLGPSRDLSAEPPGGAGPQRPLAMRVTDVRRSPTLGLTGAGVVVGAVDWGLDIDYAGFQTAQAPTGPDPGSAR